MLPLIRATKKWTGSGASEPQVQLSDIDSTVYREEDPGLRAINLTDRAFDDSLNCSVSSFALCLARQDNCELSKFLAHRML